MTTLTRYTTRLALLSLLALTMAKTALAARLRRLDADRGDVPGWAIASAAACVLGALVYGAVSGVITKYIGDIK